MKKSKVNISNKKESLIYKFIFNNTDLIVFILIFLFILLLSFIFHNFFIGLFLTLIIIKVLLILKF